MKILIDIPKDKYDLICMSAWASIGGLASKYIANGEIVEDADQKRSKTMAKAELNFGEFGGSIGMFTVVNSSQMITVPAGQTATVSAPSATKIIVFNPSVSEMTVWEDGSNTFAFENTTVIQNPQVSQMNIYVQSYASDTITLKSDSGSSRSVWVAYM